MHGFSSLLLRIVLLNNEGNSEFAVLSFHLFCLSHSLPNTLKVRGVCVPGRTLVCFNKLNSVWFYIIIKQILFIDSCKPQKFLSSDGKRALNE